MIVRELTGRRLLRSAARPDRHRPGRDRARQHRVQRRRDRARRAGRVQASPQSRRGELISIDKANVLITSQLWREVVTALARRVSRRHADARARRLVRDAPGARARDRRRRGRREPLRRHPQRRGSRARRLARPAAVGEPRCVRPGVVRADSRERARASPGRGIANPYGTILSVAMLLRHSLHRDDLARRDRVRGGRLHHRGRAHRRPRRHAGTDAVADAVAREALRHLGARSGAAS